jgi:hypothetical protein
MAETLRGSVHESPVRHLPHAHGYAVNGLRGHWDFRDSTSPRMTPGCCEIVARQPKDVSRRPAEHFSRCSQNKRGKGVELSCLRIPALW